jgi:hypothetical protein
MTDCTYRSTHDDLRALLAELTGPAAKVDSNISAWNPLDMLRVTNTKLADRCKDLLAVCGNTAFRKRLTQLEFVLRLEPTAKRPDHWNQRIAAYLSFNIWDDFVACARLVTNQPTCDFREMYNILRKMKTPIAVAMHTFKRDMVAYSKRHDEFLAAFSRKSEIERIEGVLKDDGLVQ